MMMSKGAGAGAGAGEEEEANRLRKGKSIAIEEGPLVKEGVKGQLPSKFPLLLSVGSSSTKGHAELYDPMTSRVRKIPFDVKGEIIGHNPFTHWIMMLGEDAKIWIKNGDYLIGLPFLSKPHVGKPRFGYVFDNFDDEGLLSNSLSFVVACFGETRFVVYWSQLRSPGEWKSKEFVEPMHWPDGFVVYDGKLMWINTRDGTLHILTDAQYIERVDHESYAMGKLFKFTTQAEMRFTRFSTVIDTDGKSIYFVCKEALSDGEMVVTVFDLLWGSKEGVMKDFDIDGFAFFVGHDHLGIALTLDEERKDKLYYAGFKGQDCVMMDWVVCSRREKHHPLEVVNLKECYDMDRNNMCKCHNLWLVCDDESRILKISEIVE